MNALLILLFVIGAAAGLLITQSGRRWGAGLAAISAASVLGVAVASSGVPHEKPVENPRVQQLAEELGRGLSPCVRDGSLVLVLAGPQRGRNEWLDWETGLSQGAGKPLRATIKTVDEIMTYERFDSVGAVVLQGEVLTKLGTSGELLKPVLEGRPVAIINQPPAESAAGPAPTLEGADIVATIDWEEGRPHAHVTEDKRLLKLYGPPLPDYVAPPMEEDAEESD